MTRARQSVFAVLLLFAFAGTALASWYDDYEAGLAAARAGNWSVVLQKMTAAIAARPKENPKERKYGTIFINYRPYYYRGVAYLNTGRYLQAIEDLERTSGAAEVDLGSIGELLQLAKSRQQQAAAPAAPVETRPQQPVTPPPAVAQPAPGVQTPAAPAIDPGLRQRAAAMINAAKQKLEAARRRRATAAPEFTQAQSTLASAISRNAAPKSNDDLNDVISMAQSAGDLFDLAAAPTLATTTPPQITPIMPKSQGAAETALAAEKLRLRKALEQYFAGDFDAAARELEELSRVMPRNAWVFAFLGAAQYSRYAFEADENYRKAAEESFRKARQLGSWKGGLPEKYFSKRIRKAFMETAG